MTDRVNKALWAYDYTLFVSTTDHVVMISAGEGDSKVDVLVALEDMEEALVVLRAQVNEEKPRNE